MKQRFKQFIPAIIFALLFAATAYAQVSAPNYWKANTASSTISPINPSLQVPCANIVGGCGSGGGVSTSSPNTWTATQQFSGGVTDTSSTHIVPTYTYSVCQQVGECDYTTLQAALAQASSTQVPTLIYVHAGTYSIPAGGFQICSSDLTINGDGYGTLFTTTATSGPEFLMCDATQRSWITLQNFKLQNASGANSSTAIDFDHFALSTFQNLYVTGSNYNFYASSTGSLYDKFIDNRDTVSTAGAYNYFVGKSVNNIYIEGARSGPSNSGDCFGIYGQGTIDVTLLNDDCETGAQLAIDIGNGVHNVGIYNFYSEANAIGFQIASNTYGVGVYGGNFDLATTTGGQSGPEEINNLGGIFCFYNVTVNFKNFNHCETQPNIPQYSWIQPFMDAVPTSNATATAGVMIGLELNNPTDGFTSGLTWVAGSATSTNASYTVALYGPLTTRDTFASSSLLVENTSNTASVASANFPQTFNWATSTFMPAGLYYAVIEFASTSQDYFRQSNQFMTNNWCGSNTLGAYTTTLPVSGPAFTGTGSNCPSLQLIMTSVSNTL
ncbi:MAG TPA: hypothetical protein VGG72_21440 [Bryobacteraceae bacterium]|jgi:hypothetical protein